MDIAVHLGSLLAVLFYFRHDLLNLFGAFFASWHPSYTSNDYSRLAWRLFWASLPIFIVAFFVQAYLIHYLRSAVVIGIASIVFGILLWHADKFGTQTRDNRDLKLSDGLLIGIAQAFALVPGASRSGVTMTAGLWLGLTRVEAARFSFLLAIPTILAASMYGVYKSTQQEVMIDWGLTLAVTICLFVVNPGIFFLN